MASQIGIRRIMTPERAKMPAMVSTRRSFGLVLLMLLAWTGAQLLWMQGDDRLPDWETARDVGAMEDWHGHWGPEGSGTASTLLQAFRASSGEYPALYPALSGLLARAVGLEQWNGDGPGRLALLWAWLAVLGAWGMGRALGDEGTGVLAALLLMLSPLWTALAREPLMESGMTALVAVVAAAGFAAIRDAGTQRRLEAWVLVGICAGLALLMKQTAVLALLPLGLVLVFANGRRWGGPLVALLLCVAVCGHWYISAAVSGDDYLWRSAQANPDAVGPLRQLLFYPLALLQQAWSPPVVLAFGLLGWLSWRGGLEPRTGRWSLPLAVLLLGLLILMGIPKKYPRLLLPLLPVGSVLLALWLQRWPGRLRTGALGLAALAWLATLFPLGPISSALAIGEHGLRGVDERCYQQWVRPPDPISFEWGRLVDLVEEAGGPGEAYKVGAVEWPAPPCSYQTTLHLGEHLQLRLRRGGLEGSVLTEGAWTIEDGWREGLPEVLVSEGELDCSKLPAVCAAIGGLVDVGGLSFEHPEWALELVVYRVVPQAPEPQETESSLSDPTSEDSSTKVDSSTR